MAHSDASPVCTLPEDMDVHGMCMQGSLGNANHSLIRQGQGVDGGLALENYNSLAEDKIFITRNTLYTEIIMHCVCTKAFAYSISLTSIKRCARLLKTKWIFHRKCYNVFLVLHIVLIWNGTLFFQMTPGATWPWASPPHRSTPWI